MKNTFSKTHIFAFLGTLIALSAIGYIEYNYSHLKNQTSELELNIDNLKKELSDTQAQYSTLTSDLSSAKNKNNIFEEQIGKISSTVGVLEKIKNTDSQLLQKYSKVYFLNEYYIPSKLTNINQQYLPSTVKNLPIHTGVWPHLEDMLKDAQNAGAPLKIVSAYRSFVEQTAVKTGYKILYGSGANQFSADQGYSEHQLGTTVDVISASSSVALTTAFEMTKSYDWLIKNAYKYGFVISYPKQNTFYQFEPWHWRFVGIELAKKIHEEGKYFYEFDQRTINNYLANFFD